MEIYTSERLCDYFVVCGLGDTPKILETPGQLGPGGSSSGGGDANSSSGAASADANAPFGDILELQVALRGEEQAAREQGFEVINQTIDGASSSLEPGFFFKGAGVGVFLCIRRRRPGERGPAVADVALVAVARNGGKRLHASPPPGFRLIRTSVGGREAVLNKGWFLAVRMQDVNGWEDDPALTRVEVVALGRGERPPPQTQVLADSRRMSNGRLAVALGWPRAKGISDMVFRPEVLDRFPQQDYEDFPLDPEVIPMFAFPQGMRLQAGHVTNAPPARAFPFVLTDAHGAKTYVTCCIFHEPLDFMARAKVHSAWRTALSRRDVGAAASTLSAATGPESNSSPAGGSDAVGTSIPSAIPATTIPGTAAALGTAASRSSTGAVVPSSKSEVGTSSATSTTAGSTHRRRVTTGGSSSGLPRPMSFAGLSAEAKSRALKRFKTADGVIDEQKATERARPGSMSSSVASLESQKASEVRPVSAVPFGASALRSSAEAAAVSAPPSKYLGLERQETGGKGATGAPSSSSHDSSQKVQNVERGDQMALEAGPFCKLGVMQAKEEFASGTSAASGNGDGRERRGSGTSGIAGSVSTTAPSSPALDRISLGGEEGLRKVRSAPDTLPRTLELVQSAEAAATAAEFSSNGSYGSGDQSRSFAGNLKSSLHASNNSIEEDEASKLSWDGIVGAVNPGPNGYNGVGNGYSGSLDGNGNGSSLDTSALHPLLQPRQPHQQQLSPNQHQSSSAPASALGLGDGKILWAPKCICLVSHWPFFRAFRRWLSQLYTLSLSKADLPLEKVISHLLLAMPVPEPGGSRMVLKIVDNLNDITFQLPSLQDLPLLDLSFQDLFASLSVSNILNVLALLLSEGKVLFISKRASLVTQAAESMLALLFPFSWDNCYVPRLTEPLLDYLSFPGPFLIGVHDAPVGHGGSSGGSEDLISQVRRILMADSPDAVIVDLDGNSVTTAQGLRPKVDRSLLPRDMAATLASRWSTLLRRAGVHQGLREDIDVDTPFDFAPTPEMETVMPSDCPPLDDRAVREAALCFFCAMLRGYQGFLVAPSMDWKKRGGDWFDGRRFLATVDQPRRRLLRELLETQMFANFIQRRTESMDPRFAFFDHCLETYNNSPELFAEPDRTQLLIDSTAVPAKRTWRKINPRYSLGLSAAPGPGSSSAEGIGGSVANHRASIFWLRNKKAHNGSRVRAVAHPVNNGNNNSNVNEDFSSSAGRRGRALTAAWNGTDYSSDPSSSGFAKPPSHKVQLVSGGAAEQLLGPATAGAGGERSVARGGATSGAFGTQSSQVPAQRGQEDSQNQQSSSSSGRALFAGFLPYNMLSVDVSSSGAGATAHIPANASALQNNGNRYGGGAERRNNSVAQLDPLSATVTTLELHMPSPTASGAGEGRVYSYRGDGGHVTWPRRLNKALFKPAAPAGGYGPHRSRASSAKVLARAHLEMDRERLGLQAAFALYPPTSASSHGQRKTRAAGRNPLPITAATQVTRSTTVGNLLPGGQRSVNRLSRSFSNPLSLGSAENAISENGADRAVPRLANRAALVAAGHEIVVRDLWQRPRHMATQFFGAWFLCIPMLIRWDGTPEVALLRALGAAWRMRKELGLRPDEASYRALLLACGRAGADHSPDVVRLFHELSSGVRPNAVTYGVYTQTIAHAVARKRSDLPPDLLESEALGAPNSVLDSSRSGSASNFGSNSAGSNHASERGNSFTGGAGAFFASSDGFIEADKDKAPPAAAGAAGAAGAASDAAVPDALITAMGTGNNASQSVSATSVLLNGIASSSPAALAATPPASASLLVQQQTSNYSSGFASGGAGVAARLSRSGKQQRQQQKRRRASSNVRAREPFAPLDARLEELETAGLLWRLGSAVEALEKRGDTASGRQPGGKALSWAGAGSSSMNNISVLPVRQQAANTSGDISSTEINSGAALAVKGPNVFFTAESASPQGEDESAGASATSEQRDKAFALGQDQLEDSERKNASAQISKPKQQPRYAHRYSKSEPTAAQSAAAAAPSVQYLLAEGSIDPNARYGSATAGTATVSASEAAGGETNGPVPSAGGSQTRSSGKGPALPQRSRAANVVDLHNAAANLGLNAAHSGAGAPSGPLQAQQEQQQRQRASPVCVSMCLSGGAGNGNNGRSSTIVGVVAMWSGSACPSCGTAPLDEEIMAGWHVPIGSRLRRAPGLSRTECAIRCPSCNSLMEPKLRFVVKGRRRGRSATTAASSASGAADANTGTSTSGSSSVGGVASDSAGGNADTTNVRRGYGASGGDSLRSITEDLLPGHYDSVQGSIGRRSDSSVRMSRSGTARSFSDLLMSLQDAMTPLAAKTQLPAAGSQKAANTGGTAVAATAPPELQSAAGRAGMAALPSGGASGAAMAGSALPEPAVHAPLSLHLPPKAERHGEKEKDGKRVGWRASLRFSLAHRDGGGNKAVLSSTSTSNSGFAAMGSSSSSSTSGEVSGAAAAGGVSSAESLPLSLPQTLPPPRPPATNAPSPLHFAVPPAAFASSESNDSPPPQPAPLQQFQSSRARAGSNLGISAWLREWAGTFGSRRQSSQQLIQVTSNKRPSELAQPLPLPSSPNTGISHVVVVSEGSTAEAGAGASHTSGVATASGQADPAVPVGAAAASAAAEEASDPVGDSSGNNSRGVGDALFSALSEDEQELSCLYISPAALRDQLEELLQRHGERGFTLQGMLQAAPTLLWNLWWLCARFGLPLPLPPLPGAGASAPPEAWALVGAWERKSALRAADNALSTLEAAAEEIRTAGRVSQARRQHARSHIGPEALLNCGTGTSNLDGTNLLATHPLLGARCAAAEREARLEAVVGAPGIAEALNVGLNELAMIRCTKLFAAAKIAARDTPRRRATFGGSPRDKLLEQHRRGLYRSLLLAATVPGSGAPAASAARNSVQQQQQQQRGNATPAAVLSQRHFETSCLATTRPCVVDILEEDKERERLGAATVAPGGIATGRSSPPGGGWAGAALLSLGASVSCRAREEEGGAVPAASPAKRQLSPSNLLRGKKIFGAGAPAPPSPPSSSSIPSFNSGGCGSSGPTSQAGVAGDSNRGNVAAVSTLTTGESATVPQQPKRRRKHLPALDVRPAFDVAFSRAVATLSSSELRALAPQDLGPSDQALAFRSFFGHLF